MISIHALRKESDLIIAVFKNFDRLFQSTLSVRRATEYCFNSPHSSIFQSTLSVRRATGVSRDSCRETPISIHALRKESDLMLPHDWSTPTISIHALRKESDGVGAAEEAGHSDFNPRSP